MNRSDRASGPSQGFSRGLLQGLCMAALLAVLSGCASTSPPPVTESASPEASGAPDVFVGDMQLCVDTVRDAVILDNPYDSYPVLEIALTDESARRFAYMTGQLVGQSLDITYDGEVLSSPIVREQIPGGRLNVTGIEMPLLQKVLSAVSGRC
ncbi:MAG: SecDF P1 head subdomain-containing protein [Sphingomonadaceae bacterium]